MSKQVYLRAISKDKDEDLESLDLATAAAYRYCEHMDLDYTLLALFKGSTNKDHAEEASRAAWHWYVMEQQAQEYCCGEVELIVVSH